MKAIILAGGFGTRLQSVVSDLPKAMASINGEPFLSILLKYLKNQGITEVILAVSYLKEHIIEYFGNNFDGINIYYSIEDEPLGTGGAIIKALSLVNNNENVFILNGDTFCPILYKDFLKEYFNNSSNFAIVLKKVKNVSRYAKVEVNKDGFVSSFLDKQYIDSGLISCGIYLVNKDLFTKFLLPKVFSFETDFLGKYIHDINLFAFQIDSYFIDIGIPEDYQLFCNKLKNETK